MNLSVSSKVAAATAAALGFFGITGCDRPSAMNQSTTYVRHITQGEFEAEVTRCTNPVVVEFYATWCESCRVLAPMVEQQASNHADQIKFVKINIDESPGIAQNFQVQGMPTVIFIRDGKVATRYAEAPNEATFKAKMDSFVAVK